MSNHRFTTIKTLSRGPARAALLALCLLGGAQGAMANCNIFPGSVGPPPSPAFVPRTINMDMGTVIIPQNQALNSVIATRDFPLGAEAYGLLCDASGGQANGVVWQGTVVPGETYIFTTNVTGIGIRLSRFIPDGGADSTGGATGTIVYYPHTQHFSAGATAKFYANSYFRVELIKIGPVTGNGPLSSGTYTTYSGDDVKPLITTVLSGNGITIITPSCTVGTGSRNISVPLGNVALSRFGGMGTTAGDKPFKIQLNCQPGQNAQNLVYLRMDATQDPATSAPGVLKITGGTDIAGGVGIQVLDKDATPVPFGDDVLVGPSKDGAYVLPYTARYYQTASTVTPGRADGTATFTLSYK